MRVLVSPQGVHLKEGHFVLKRGILLQVSPGHGRKLRLVVPSYFRRDVLNQCHDLPTGGHLGEAKLCTRSLNVSGGRALGPQLAITLNLVCIASVISPTTALQ